MPENLEKIRAKVHAHATRVFGDEAIAADWLNTPNRALGCSPVTLLDNVQGIKAIDNLLGRIEHGVFS